MSGDVDEGFEDGVGEVGKLLLALVQHETRSAIPVSRVIFYLPTQARALFSTIDSHTHPYTTSLYQL